MEQVSDIVQQIAPALEPTLAQLLAQGEQVVAKLPGLDVQAFAATDRRVIFLRGIPSPNIGDPPAVDVVEIPLDQVRGASITGVVGDTRLQIDASTPPEAGKRSLAFSVMDQPAFRRAVEEIRKLLPPAPEEPVAQAPADADMCPGCGARTSEDDRFCPICGAKRGERCVACAALLRKGAAFCSRCGSRTDVVAQPCPGCGRPVVETWWSFCPDCGHIVGSKCGRCGSGVVPTWKFCVNCGRELAGGRVDVSGRSVHAPSRTDEEVEQRIREPEAPIAGETPGDLNAHGQALFEAGKMEQAVEVFERAVELDPNTALYHCNLAVSYDEMDRDEEAADEYRKALELDPNDVVSMLGLGYIYSESEDKEGAERMWKRVIEIAPNSPEAQEAGENLRSLDVL